ncbi:MAG: EAL domain-containing protein [Burkholderiaceae bacterium]
MTPRLAWAGAAMVFAAIGVIGTSASLGMLVLEVRASQTQEVQRRLRELETVFGAVQAEFPMFEGPPVGAPSRASLCTDAIRRGLLEMSLHSDHARRFFWVPAAGSGACAPGGKPIDAVTIAALRERVTSPNDEMQILRSGDKRLILVKRLADAGLLAAELSEARWRQPLGGFSILPDEHLTLHDWHGRVLHGASAAASTGPWQTLMALLQARLSASADSHNYRLTLILAPSVSALSAAIESRLMIAWAAALVLALMVIASINRTLQDRSSIVRRLRKALRKREIEPVVQPFVDAASGRCVGAEVLMRWRHPIRGLLVPAEFLAVAEQTGLIADMTWQLLTKSRDLLDPIVRDEPRMLFSFNFGVQMLRDPAFVDRLGAVFHDSMLRPGNVCIELLERDAVDDRSIDMLHVLRRAGYKVAIDDFGTGQSNLALLSQISFDTLKIDREFVRAIDGDSMNRPVLSAIIDLAERLGVRTTAEGVETVEQHRYLLARGVDILQGYLIARPMPIAEFARWLRANRLSPGYADRHDGDAFGDRSIATDTFDDALAAVTDGGDGPSSAAGLAGRTADDDHTHEPVTQPGQATAQPARMARDAGRLAAAAPVEVRSRGSDPGSGGSLRISALAAARRAKADATSLRARPPAFDDLAMAGGERLLPI